MKYLFLVVCVLFAFGCDEDTNCKKYLDRYCSAAMACSLFSTYPIIDEARESGCEWMANHLDEIDGYVFTGEVLIDGRTSGCTKKKVREVCQ